MVVRQEKTRCDPEYGHEGDYRKWGILQANSQLEAPRRLESFEGACSDNEPPGSVHSEFTDFTY